MGRIARYIDSLGDEQRDRVLQAQEWMAYPGGAEFSAAGRVTVERCLIEHAHDCDFLDPVVPEGSAFVGARFDRACSRFGLDRVVRACKQRAARGSYVAQPEEAVCR